MLPGWKMRLVSSNGLSVTTKKLAVSGWCVKQWWSVLWIPTVLALNPGWAISWPYDLRQAHYLVWFYLIGGIVRDLGDNPCSVPGETVRTQYMQLQPFQGPTSFSAESLLPHCGKSISLPLLCPISSFTHFFFFLKHLLNSCCVHQHQRYEDEWKAPTITPCFALLVLFL